MSAFYSHDRITPAEDTQSNLIAEVASINCNDYSLDFLFDYDTIINWIQAGEFKKICFQFPDYMLCKALTVTKDINGQLEKDVQIFIVGESFYESCCVDYLSAAHVNADAIVHFGKVCFSKAANLIPTLYIYEKAKLNLDKFFKAFFFKFSNAEEVNIILDTPYMYMKERLLLIKKLNTNIVINDILEPFNCSGKVVLYIGAPDRKLFLFNILQKPTKLFYYNDSNPDFVEEFTSDNSIFKRRSFLIEKVKDSSTVGIIVGTLAIHNFKVVIERIKKLCKIHNKKYYLISVGRVNVEKLANYPELDIYVLIGCAMNDVYESRDFFKPIVAPYDVEVALNPKSDDLVLYDLIKLSESSNNLEDIQPLDPDVSLLSGKIRSVTLEEKSSDASSELVQKSDGSLMVYDKNGAGFLNSRTWKGLQQNLGETPVELAQEGRKGLAASYQSELQNDS